MGSSLWRFMTLCSHGLLISRDNLKNIYFHYHSAYDHQNWQAGYLHEGLLPMLLHPLVTWSCEITWQTISTAAISLATNLGRMVNNLDYLLPIKKNDHITTWFCEIIWQTKSISPLPQCLWPQNLKRWWLTLSDFQPRSHTTVLLRVL